MKPTEKLRGGLENYLKAPFPLWEVILTKELVQRKYDELSAAGIRGRACYNTAAALNLCESLPDKEFLAHYCGGEIYLEKPDFKNLRGFYEEHGLIPLNELQLVKEEAATKVNAALGLLSLVPECIACISSLVNCIQVVAAEGPEYDTSYSHPDIPFTAFVSVCRNIAVPESIRIAESILHEAMHLKLSLLQQHIHLVQPGTNETFYSPWRETHRPLNGVLHGLFVFRAIRDFFLALKPSFELETSIYTTICYRISEIQNDFQALEHFSDSKGLTAIGKAFSYRLLKE